MLNAYYYYMHIDTANSAPWENRFWAWLIDMLLVGLFFSMFRGCLGIAGSFYIEALGVWLVAFVYWTALEGYRGQSIGKMVMNIAVVDASGNMVGYEKAAVECFGKSFLLPLDCLIGWLAKPGSGQRLFNNVSDTVVIKADASETKSLQSARMRSRIS